jgi:hypothetical protein
MKPGKITALVFFAVTLMAWDATAHEKQMKNQPVCREGF